MQTNIKQAYANINGMPATKTLATYDEATDTWTVEMVAPAESSWKQPGHVFNVDLFAEDLAGNVGTMTSADPTWGTQLKIRVLEKTAPTATIKYPTTGSVLGSSTQTITMELTDAGGSGINIATAEFQLDSKVVEDIEWSPDGEDGGKYTATYEATGLSDGIHNLSLKVTDNDLNESKAHTVQFTISTAAPHLSITEPADNLITNKKTVTVAGTTSPGSEYVTIKTVTIDGESVTVEDGGSFSKDVTFKEDGTHEIVIVATDSAGNSTTVRRTIVIDTQVPVITDVHAEAVTVNASGIIRITFKVVENE